MTKIRLSCIAMAKITRPSLNVLTKQTSADCTDLTEILTSVHYTVLTKILTNTHCSALTEIKTSVHCTAFTEIPTNANSTALPETPTSADYWIGRNTNKCSLYCIDK